MNFPSAPCGLPAEFAKWPQAIDGLDEGMRAALGPWLVREWVQGRLEPMLAAPELRELRRVLAEVTSKLEDRELILLPPGGNPDAESVRRWCWIVPWHLYDQDEDLMLMRDELVIPLLEEAAAGCPKRAYAREIATHHLRDQAHAKLRSGAEALRTHLESLAPFVDSARSTRDQELVVYLERLQSYAKPQRVTREAALERVSDLWRCRPAKNVSLEETGTQWRAQLSARPDHEEWIVIDRKFGTMWLDAPGQARAKRKGRR